MVHTYDEFTNIHMYFLAGPVDFVICDHMRAPELYTASVLASPVCPMRAFPCKSMYDFERGYCFKCAGDSCPSMGFHADETQGLSKGKHFLYTSGSMPFCGEYCLKLCFGLSRSWHGDFELDFWRGYYDVSGDNDKYDDDDDDIDDKNDGYEAQKDWCRNNCQKLPTVRIMT